MLKCKCQGAKVKTKNCYDKLFDALLTGPKDRKFLLKYVGIGFAARISEYNKVYGKVLRIANINGLYRIIRRGRINVSKTI